MDVPARPSRRAVLGAAGLGVGGLAVAGLGGCARDAAGVPVALATGA